MARLLEFLQHSFSGGTDVDKPFELALQRLQKAEWCQVRNSLDPSVIRKSISCSRPSTVRVPEEPTVGFGPVTAKFLRNLEPEPECACSEESPILSLSPH